MDAPYCLPEHEIVPSPRYSIHPMASAAAGSNAARIRSRNNKTLKRRIADLEQHESCGESAGREEKRKSFFRYVQNRPTATHPYSKAIHKMANIHLSKTMPAIMTETTLDLKTYNKVFASQWLDERTVVMGTKCNNILVKDVYTDSTSVIKPIPSTERYDPADCPCGIHAIEVNPSGTMLATGATSTNELAIYNIPSFEPHFLGEGCHRDWIFDIKWISDDMVVTGSRDSNLAIWRLDEEEIERQCPQGKTDLTDNTSASLQPVTAYVGHCHKTKRAKQAEKLRALAFNSQRMEMGAISLNEYILTWDLETLTQTQAKRLPRFRETVCMAYDDALSVYAVGSASHVTLLDSRTLRQCINIESLEGSYGIRSVSFNDKIVTIGTGYGTIIFYDMNAGKYLNCDCGYNYKLKANQGFLLQDNNWRDLFADTPNPHAIYTHCYDSSKTRLFAAGGPLPTGLIGNYAAVWQ